MCCSDLNSTYSYLLIGSKELNIEKTVMSKTPLKSFEEFVNRFLFSNEEWGKYHTHSKNATYFLADALAACSSSQYHVFVVLVVFVVVVPELLSKSEFFGVP